MGPPDPEEVTAAAAPAVADIPPETRPGAVHLTVADLDRSIGYYEWAVGLRVHDRAGGRAALGTGGEELLVLFEEPGARPAGGFCGLYHFALLVPERADLARWLAHAARERVPLVGLSDHFVSEAIYLSDPDEHGIEIYWDRPRDLWEGSVAERMTTLPLDTRSLLGELRDPANEPFEGLAGGTVMGHVHLRVADIPSTIAFYRDVLGLGLMASFGEQAAFLSAGGYHHHVGANTWESAGAPQAPPGSATLKHATLVLPDDAARDRIASAVTRAGQEPEPLDGGVLVRDPSGNPILLRVAATSWSP
jgi:catechol 2,3-dioxygenase